MAIFRMMVGLPGSGKDYYISQNKNPQFVIRETTRDEKEQ